MDLETTVSPAAETQNPAADPLAQTPEVAEPESAETPEQAQEEAQPDEADKSLKRMERRIQRLTAAKYQTLAEANQAKAEAEALRQKLAQYEQPEDRVPQGPDPIALAREISKIEKIAERSNAVAKEGATRYPDFEQAVQAIARDVGPLFDRVGRTTGLGEAVLAADDPAAVLHAIGTDPDLAADLSEMTPIQQARRIAKLEAELSAPKAPPKSNAPKPLEPVKATKADAGGLDDSLDMREWTKRFYEARRNR